MPVSYERFNTQKKAPDTEIKLDYELQDWLRSMAPSNEENEDSNKLLIYTISAPYNKKTAFRISPFVTNIIKKGTFGASRKKVQVGQIYSYLDEKYVKKNDETILRLISACIPYHSSYNEVHDIPISSEAQILLEAIVKTGRCYLVNENIPANIISFGETKKVKITWKTDSNGTQNINLDIEEIKNPLILPLMPPYYICRETRKIGLIDTGLPSEDVAALKRYSLSQIPAISQLQLKPDK